MCILENIYLVFIYDFPLFKESFVRTVVVKFKYFFIIGIVSFL